MGKLLRFGFTEFLPVGLLSFGIILAIGIAAALTIANMAPRTGVP